MAWFLMVACAWIWVCLATTPAYATPSPNFQIQILPLACSFDTLALGSATALQVTPEGCLPQELQLHQTTRLRNSQFAGATFEAPLLGSEALRPAVTPASPTPPGRKLNLPVINGNFGPARGRSSGYYLPRSS